MLGTGTRALPAVSTAIRVTSASIRTGEIITATTVTAGNAGDAEPAADLLAQDIPTEDHATSGEDDHDGDSAQRAPDNSGGDPLGVYGGDVRHTFFAVRGRVARLLPQCTAADGGLCSVVVPRIPFIPRTST